MARSLRHLLGSEDAAVAPTVALSLFALIAAGGLAFDYARMASLDSELQNAADQAALAAASQLDGEAGACSRAAAAARNMITNLTYLANDGALSGTQVTIADEPTCDATGNVRFYQDKAKTQPATDDTNAKFVEIQVDPRRADFALTPIVGAFNSGELRAIAFAGLGEAICRVPPLMMCNPDEDGDPNFTVANYVGVGMRLVANDGGGNYGPGNFGFLDVGQGANDLRAILGRNGDPGECASGSTVTTEPGNMITLRDALNTRFDMYENGLNQACGANGDLCPPSFNTRIDLMRAGNGNNSCTWSQTGAAQGWQEPSNNYPNLPTTTAPRALNDTEIAGLSPMGYPRDICHAFSVEGSCVRDPLGIIGTGTWDRYAYFRSHALTTPANYPEISDTIAMNQFLQDTFNTLTPTRFAVYRWEMGQAFASGTRLDPVVQGALTSSGTPVCNPPGVNPGVGEIDRRVLSVAVINCVEEGVQGKTPDTEVTKFIDVFLTEPAVPRQRTEIHDIYVEIIGESAQAAQGNNPQLVKKAVPYLIE